MNLETKIDTALTVQSLAYMARKMALSPAAPAPSVLYVQVLGEAEKHRSALRLMQRDVFEMAEQGLRKRTLTKTEFHRLRKTTAQRITQAQQEITRIAALYAPHKLAA